MLCFVIFCVWKGNKDGSGWEQETGRAERRETSLVIAELKELSFFHRSALYLLKENRGHCLLGWRMEDGRRGLFQLLYESKVWFVALVFLSTHTTGIAFSKFLFFMVCLISSFHFFLFDLLPKYKMKKDIHQV